MDLGVTAALFEVCAGAGALAWAAYIFVSGLREHRRKVTAEVEIQGSFTLPTGRSYRFTPVSSTTGEPSREYAGTPQEFDDLDFSEGDRVRIDFDPGYPLFFYPAGKYPRARLWPVALAAGVLGSGTAGLGIVNLL
ncbi:hypothetical protein AB0K80_11215 [Streptomyces sp. NPDC052682]|uniref:hypothetical protein n=1 Tax=Streptomyces sp. NPDC052682 TaxID=3154954 RepID=UPI0034278422